MNLLSPQIKILELLRRHGDRANIVKFIEWFEFMGLCCLVFELLDTDLHHVYTRVKALSIVHIRSVAKQVCIIVLWH